MNSWVKWALIIGAVLFVGFGLMGVCSVMYGGEPAGSGPKATVEAAVRAYESKDINKVLAYFNPTPAGKMKPTLIRLFASADKIDVQLFKAINAYEEGLAAHVDASWDFIVWVNKSPSVEHYTTTVKLVKIDGTWYINSAW